MDHGGACSCSHTEALWETEDDRSAGQNWLPVWLLLSWQRQYHKQLQLFRMWWRDNKHVMSFHGSVVGVQVIVVTFDLPVGQRNRPVCVRSAAEALPRKHLCGSAATQSNCPMMHEQLHLLRGMLMEEVKN